MIDHELKQCPICGELRADYEFEEVFTGRMQRICFKCMREGLNQTRVRLIKHKAAKMKRDGTK